MQNTRGLLFTASVIMATGMLSLFLAGALFGLYLLPL